MVRFDVTAAVKASNRVSVLAELLVTVPIAIGLTNPDIAAADDQPAVAETPAEHRMGGARNYPARARKRPRCEVKDAAELTGISQRTLSYYLAKYRLD